MVDTNYKPKPRILRVVVVEKYSNVGWKTVKSALDVCKRNKKAGYMCYITEK